MRRRNHLVAGQAVAQTLVRFGLPPQVGQEGVSVNKLRLGQIPAQRDRIAVDRAGHRNRGVASDATASEIDRGAIGTHRKRSVGKNLGTLPVHVERLGVEHRTIQSRRQGASDLFGRVVAARGIIQHVSAGVVSENTQQPQILVRTDGIAVNRNLAVRQRRQQRPHLVRLNQVSGAHPVADVEDRTGTIVAELLRGGAEGRCKVSGTGREPFVQGVDGDVPASAGLTKPSVRATDSRSTA